MVVLSALFLALVPTAAADASACPGVRLFYARGSGAPVADDEFRDTVAALTGALGRRPGVTEIGDLDGDGRLDPGGYPAVAVEEGVGLDPVARWDENDLVVMARYNVSRRIGTAEFVRVVGAEADRCRRTRFVVVGYSQGAQAIGVGLRSLPAPTLDRVRSVVFLGDPTIAPGWRGAPAPWVRAPGVVWTVPGGLLGPRDPYVPESLVPRTRSYCGLSDPVCTGNPFLWIWKALPCERFPAVIECRRTHDDYALWAIGPAMTEAAAAVARR